LNHIADTELVEGLRLRRILSEDLPQLPALEESTPRDENNHRFDASVGAFQGAVLANAARLERLEEAEWLRAGRYGAGEPLSVEDWLRRMTSHAQDHASQLLQAVEQGAAGKPH
jgi:hypothetical protein